MLKVILASEIIVLLNFPENVQEQQTVSKFTKTNNITLVQQLAKSGHILYPD